jgi:hypothetical protein
VLSVDYRLAPEHPYPAATDDALASYRGLLETGIRPERIGLFGESAGGALAQGLLVAMRDSALAQPAAAVLYSPWVDLTLFGASMDTKAAVDFVLAHDRLLGNVSDYAGSADPAAAALSPLFADLRGIAPLLIQCGSNEVLLDDATRLASAAAAADVAVQLDARKRSGALIELRRGGLKDVGHARRDVPARSWKPTCRSPGSGRSAARRRCRASAIGRRTRSWRNDLEREGVRFGGRLRCAEPKPTDCQMVGPPVRAEPTPRPEQSLAWSPQGVDHASRCRGLAMRL